MFDETRPALARAFVALERRWMAKGTYRIKVQVEEAAPFPFRWQLYAGAETEPFLTSKQGFRSDKAAVADAVAFLARSNKRGIVER